MSLVVTVSMAFVLMPAVVAEEQTQPAEEGFQSITVDVAYTMITNGYFPNLLS